MEKKIAGLGLLVLFSLVVPGESFVGFLVDAKLALDTVTGIANAMGTSGEGQIPLKEGCVINWSFKGGFSGFRWKYTGTCTDSCTKQTETVKKNSRGGAVEHCIQNLMNKI